jgi:hypothetical protein
MVVPEPLEQLFQWIEERGLYLDRPKGRIGFLFPEEEMKAGWTDSGRPGGTNIDFYAEGDANLRHWFNKDSDEITSRLCVFCRTGGDGSTGAFWLDDQGQQRIVHLGSGSGSIMVCVLADDPVDFLRLLAIGYDEVCWGGFDGPPNPGEEFTVAPNDTFRDWVRTTFGVTIPAHGSEIVKHEADMGDAGTADPFCRWVNAVIMQDE